jgi:hypothetical protein
MLRRALKILSTLSLLSCAALTYFWLSCPPGGQSILYRWRWEANGNRATSLEWVINRSPSNLLLARDEMQMTSDRVPALAKRADLGWEQYTWSDWPSTNRFSTEFVFDLQGYGSIAKTSRAYQQIGFPFWFAIVVTAILPTAWLFIATVSRLRGRRLQNRGQCPVCGYDMRATPERCPECGNVSRVTA